MYYVYLLYSSELDSFYLGSTVDLKRRLEEHKSGRVKSTKHVRDWRLAYYEGHLTEASARRRERALKRSGGVYHSLKTRVRKSLEEAGNLGEGEALDRSPGKRRP